MRYFACISIFSEFSEKRRAKKEPFFGGKSAVSLRTRVGWSPIYTPDGTRVNTVTKQTIGKIFFANSKTPEHGRNHVYNFMGENYFYYPGVAAGSVLQNTFFEAHQFLRHKI